jgi:hypothetical protein
VSSDLPLLPTGQAWELVELFGKTLFSGEAVSFISLLVSPRWRLDQPTVSVIYHFAIVTIFFWEER